MARGNRRTSRVVGLMGLLLMASSAGLAWGTHELPTTCLPTPLPQMPGTPSWTLEVHDFGEVMQFDVWRSACIDGSGLSVPLMRVTPTKGAPFLCGGSFDVIQEGFQYQISLLTQLGVSSSFCQDLLVPATFIIAQSSSVQHFDMDAAFTLVFDGVFELFSLEIAAAEDGEEGPTPLAGTLTGFVPSKVLCVNQTTRRRVQAQVEGLAWDCTAAGLQTQPGDRLKVTIQGTVPGD